MIFALAATIQVGCHPLITIRTKVSERLTWIAILKVAAPPLKVDVKLFYNRWGWLKAHARACDLANCFTGFLLGFLLWEDV